MTMHLWQSAQSGDSRTVCGEVANASQIGTVIETTTCAVCLEKLIERATSRLINLPASS